MGRSGWIILDITKWTIERHCSLFDLGPGHTVVSCLCDSGQVRECGSMNFTSKKTLEPINMLKKSSKSVKIGFFIVKLNFLKRETEMGQF